LEMIFEPNLPISWILLHPHHHGPRVGSAKISLLQLLLLNKIVSKKSKFM
jgi:hypothetical protein